MGKNIFSVVLLSLLFAVSLVYDLKLAIAIILMITSVILISRSELVFICIYFFVYFVLAGFVGRMSFSLSGAQSINLLGILNIIMILFFYFKVKDFLQLETWYWNKHIIYPVILFSLYLLLTVPFSISLLTSIRGLTRLLSAFSFYLLAYFVVVKNSHVEKKIFKFITIVFVFLSVYGIIEYVTGYNIFYNRLISSKIYLGYEVIQTFSRIRTTFYHPSQYSFALLILLPLYLFYFVKKKEKKYFYGLIVLLFLINILLTFTRITWIALFIQLLLFLILFKPKKIMRFALPLGIAVILLSGQIIARATTVDGSTLQRFEFFQFGLELFKAHPVFGCGLETFFELSTSRFGENIAAHGDYIRMFAETGAFGGIGSLMLLSMMIIFAIKNFKENDFAKVSFLMIMGFLIFGITDNAWGYCHIFWGLLGIYNGVIVREKIRLKTKISRGKVDVKLKDTLLPV